MTIATIFANDAPGNQTINSAAINQNASPAGATDITVNNSPISGGPFNLSGPTTADKPSTVGPNSETFTLTVTGPSVVSARAGLYGSFDGISWQSVGSISVQGSGSAVGSQTMNRPYTYWTGTVEFTSPGATSTLTITY